MEINSQRLQRADSGAQTEKGGTPREPDSASKEKFERVMERDSEQGSGRGEKESPATLPRRHLPHSWKVCSAPVWAAWGMPPPEASEQRLPHPVM